MEKGHHSRFQPLSFSANIGSLVPIKSAEASIPPPACLLFLRLHLHPRFLALDVGELPLRGIFLLTYSLLPVVPFFLGISLLPVPKLPFLLPLQCSSTPPCAWYSSCLCPVCFFCPTVVHLEDHVVQVLHHQTLPAGEGAQHEGNHCQGAPSYSFKE